MKHKAPLTETTAPGKGKLLLSDVKTKAQTIRDTAKSSIIASAKRRFTRNLAKGIEILACRAAPPNANSQNLDGSV